LSVCSENWGYPEAASEAVCLSVDD